jgi:putative transposase
VSTWQGSLYVEFVIDVFVRWLVGWRVPRTRHIGFVLDALEQVPYDHQPERGNGLAHRTEVLNASLSAIQSVRTLTLSPRCAVGDSCDNALAETINGLYKPELIHRRLLAPVGDIPSEEAGENYYRQRTEQAASTI